jgi:hypothetical protein
MLKCGRLRVGAGFAAVVSAFSARACAERVGAAKSRAKNPAARRYGVRMMA